MSLQRLRSFALRVAGTAFFSALISVGTTVYTSTEVSRLEALVQNTAEAYETQVEENNDLRYRIQLLEDQSLSNKIEFECIYDRLDTHASKLSELAPVVILDEPVEEQASKDNDFLNFIF